VAFTVEGAILRENHVNRIPTKACASDKVVQRHQRLRQAQAVVSAHFTEIEDAWRRHFGS
jgi:hypothetical protein